MKKTIADFENEIIRAFHAKMILQYYKDHKEDDIITYSLCMSSKVSEDAVKELTKYIKSNFHNVYEIQSLDHIRVIYVSFDMISF